VRLGKLSEFPDGDCRIFSVQGLEVGVFRRGAKLIAWENRCPHYGGPVCQGKIFNRVEEVLGRDQASEGLAFARDEHIVCPWHGYEFNLETGRHPGDPKMRLRKLDVQALEDGVYLRMP
jgi:nitrite reductase/ring-hydroxylating ferredoxin subunit